ncbi:hypothetical protein VTI74DRAFT_2412 [Chaetomium olivicolor]
MPTTRRSSRSSTGAGSKASGKQQTLSFKHKVTKAIKTGKEPYKSPARAKEYVPELSPETEAASPTTSNKKSDLPSPAEQQTPVATDDEKDTKLREIGQQAQPAPQEKSEIEAKAEQLSDAAIEKYWSGIEASRNAREVHRKHTEGLTTGEKVLRYFDVSSQYGPCIGIARLKRWQRAQRLGLNPPLEVLAVLLKEEAKGNKGIERAHMDELLNAAAVGSVGV